MTDEQMTREEAMNVAVEALEYALDNDTEYVSEETERRWQAALETLNKEDLNGPVEAAIRLLRERPAAAAPFIRPKVKTIVAAYRARGLTIGAG